jgi:hypothetical protein
MTRVAIIGTAGRGPDAKILASDPQRYLDRMLAAARKVSELTGAVNLVSGGASYSDHMAVLLFLQEPERYRLELELPAKLVECPEGYCYDDNGTRDFKSNPGAVSNHYLKQMQKAFKQVKPGWSPFGDFRLLEGNPRVTVTVTPGFLPRNLKVAEKADHVLAMTFGQGKRLKDGGTAHTMAAFLKRGVGTAYHLDLNTLKLYPNATVN